jgi:hypothetical protein
VGRLTAPRSLIAAALAWGLSLGCALRAEAAAPSEGSALAPEEAEGVRRTLLAFARAMSEGDASSVGRLLSARMPPEERSRIISRVRGEFERFRYLRFAFDLGGAPTAERLPTGELEVMVPAAYEYEARAQTHEHMAGTGRNSYRFRLAPEEDEWRIVSSDIFDQFTTLRVEKVLGLVFLGAFLAVLAVFLWGWMALDAWVRTGRASWALLLLLSTPVGAAVYFVAVYLRGKFLPARGG